MDTQTKLKENESNLTVQFPPVPFYYNYKKDKHQMVYVGEFFGTTFIIAAKFKYIENKGDKYMVVDLVSKNVGGTIKYSLLSINPVAKKDKDGFYNLDITIKPFTSRDSAFDPVTVALDKDFKLDDDFLRIDIPNSKILGLNNDNIFYPKELPINNLRSCNICSIFKN